MKKLNFLIMLVLAVLFGSCKGTGSSSKIEFETLEGKIEKPVSFADADLPYDSISVDYKIAWPVRGDEKVTGLIKGWIIEQLSGDRNVDSSNLDIMEILNLMAEKLASSDGAVNQTIEVIAEEATPFESYLTVNLNNETSFWMAHYSDYKNSSLSIRRTDGKVFNPDNFIVNTKKMCQLIEASLSEEFLKDHKDNFVDDWNNWIGAYNPDLLPIPSQQIRLTKEGLLINYLPGEISSNAAGAFSCVVPYDEVIYFLSDDAQEFLTKPEEEKIDDNTKTSKNTQELTKTKAIEIIKKANLHEPGSLSADFKAAIENNQYYRDNPLLSFGNDVEKFYVENPNIKILKIFTDIADNKATMIIDFFPADYPEMGWISTDGYPGRYCAIDFVFEDGQWVVDDYHEYISNVGMGEFVNLLKSGEYEGMKSLLTEYADHY